MWNNNYAKQWTPTAKECYERGCVCDGCLLFEQIGYQCRMKGAVLELVRKFGKPPEDVDEKFTKYEKSVMEAIKNGCNTIQEISEKLNKKESAIVGVIHVLYLKAKELGWQPVKKGIVKKCLLPQFISWVRKESEG